VASATSAYWLEQNVWPTIGTKAEIFTSLGVGVAALGRITEMDVTAGVITATVNGADIDGSVNGKKLTLVPQVNVTDSSITWSWTSADMPQAYIPKR